MIFFFTKSLVMVHNPAHVSSKLVIFCVVCGLVGCGTLSYLVMKHYNNMIHCRCDPGGGGGGGGLDFFLLKSLLAGMKTAMYRYGLSNTYPCVFNMKRTTYLYLSADFYDASQFEMINFAILNIEHYNSDPVISLFGNMQITLHIWKMKSRA